MERLFAAYQGDEPYVFVSYAHEDADAVYPEIARLHELGINLWYDEGISPGRRWSEELAQALSGASTLLYFVSPASVSSAHCLDEVNFALDAKKATLAVHLKPTELTPGLKLRLSSHQAIFKHELDEPAYWQKLTTAIHGQHSASPNDHLSAPLPSKNRARPVIAMAAVVAIAIALGVLTLVLMRDDPEPSPVVADEVPVVIETKPAVVTPSGQSIAVLPFKNNSISEENAFFASGVHDDVMTTLSKIGLSVTSHTSVSQFADTSLGAPEISEQLGLARRSRAARPVHPMLKCHQHGLS